MDDAQSPPYAEHIDGIAATSTVLIRCWWLFPNRGGIETMMNGRFDAATNTASVTDRWLDQADLPAHGPVADNAETWHIAIDGTAVSLRGADIAGTQTGTIRQRTETAIDVVFSAA